MLTFGYAEIDNLLENIKLNINCEQELAHDWL